MTIHEPELTGEEQLVLSIRRNSNDQAMNHSGFSDARRVRRSGLFSASGGSDL